MAQKIARWPSFDKWLEQDIHKMFGLARIRTLKRLTDWLAPDKTLIPPFEQTVMNNVSELAEMEGAVWNEEDVKLYSIGPLLSLANFHSSSYRGFGGARLEAMLTSLSGETRQISGVVDWMAAAGYNKPDTPYFFLHEYKRSHGGKNPEGQLLIEMLAAQSGNADGRPIYGSFIYGREWCFAILEGKEYAVSKAFQINVAPDICAIYWALIRAKAYVESILAVSA